MLSEGERKYTNRSVECISSCRNMMKKPKLYHIPATDRIG